MNPKDTYEASVQVKEKVDLNKTFLSVIDLFKSRPGEFLRQFHFLYNLFGDKVSLEFSKVINRLSTVQLLKFEKYLETIEERKSLIFAPSAQWSKAQFVDNDKKPIDKASSNFILEQISIELGKRIDERFPEGIDLDIKLKEVKLQTNSQELATYGRGTSFDIPEDMSFIRSGSYWQIEGCGHIWFDNGWNFFDEKWEPKGSCCSGTDLRYLRMEQFSQVIQQSGMTFMVVVAK